MEVVLEKTCVVMLVCKRHAFALIFIALRPATSYHGLFTAVSRLEM